MTFRTRPLPRTGPTLTLVTIGLGLNLRASILLGPHLHERFATGPGSYLVLIALPVLVAALARVPVGVLTDRYGARVMFPAVSLLAAVAVAGLGLAGSLPVAVVAGALAGAASSAFVVGGALTARLFPYGERGRALGVYGLGAALAAGLSAASWLVDRDGRITALLLSGLLVVFAGLAAALIRGDPSVPGGATGSPVREAAALIRLASTSSVSLLYVVALGGLLSIAVFLPVYLATALHADWTRSLAGTGAVVVLAAAARLAGGRRTDRRPTARLLVICYGLAAGLLVTVALAPRSWVAVAAIAGTAVCDGVAGGALLALIGKTTRPYSVGSVLGVTGAAGTLGALTPPALLAGVHGLTGSYAPGWALLAAVYLAAARYVRAFDLRVGLGLAVRFRPGPRPTATTVAVLGEPDTRASAATVVAGLAELATSDELIIVYGVDEPGLSATALADGFRARLPRHRVVAVPVHENPEQLGRDALLLNEHFEAGALTIAVTRTASRHRVAGDLSIYLQADRVMTVSYDPAGGASYTRSDGSGTTVRVWVS